MSYVKPSLIAWPGRQVTSCVLPSIPTPIQLLGCTAQPLLNQLPMTPPRHWVSGGHRPCLIHLCIPNARQRSQSQWMSTVWWIFEEFMCIRMIYLSASQICPKKFHFHRMIDIGRQMYFVQNWFGEMLDEANKKDILIAVFKNLLLC